MNAIKKARKLIENKPGSDAAKTLASLVRALESDEKFDLGQMYKLDYDSFEICIEVLKDWRLERYYLGKIRLHDLSVQLGELQA
jgi:hypothetical protein